MQNSITSMLLLFSCWVVSDSLRPYGLQHARLPCTSPSPWVCSHSCPLSWWCHPTISFSVTPFSSGPQSFPASGSFQYGININMNLEGLSSCFRGKEPACQCRRPRFDPWVRKTHPGGGNSNPLQYSCSENSMDRGKWWVTVHGVAKESDMTEWLSTHTNMNELFYSLIFILRVQKLVWIPSVQFSRSVVSDSLRPHGLQHARLPCPSPTPGVHSNSCPLSR